MEAPIPYYEPAPMSYPLTLDMVLNPTSFFSLLPMEVLVRIKKLRRPFHEELLEATHRRRQFLDVTSEMEAEEFENLVTFEGFDSVLEPAFSKRKSRYLKELPYAANLATAEAYCCADQCISVGCGQAVNLSLGARRYWALWKMNFDHYQSNKKLRCEMYDDYFELFCVMGKRGVYAYAQCQACSGLIHDTRGNALRPATRVWNIREHTDPSGYSLLRACDPLNFRWVSRSDKSYFPKEKKDPFRNAFSCSIPIVKRIQDVENDPLFEVEECGPYEIDKPIPDALPFCYYARRLPCWRLNWFDSCRTQPITHILHVQCSCTTTYSRNTRSRKRRAGVRSLSALSHVSPVQSRRRLFDFIETEEDLIRQGASVWPSNH